jgi:hypothetical protein
VVTADNDDGCGSRAESYSGSVCEPGKDGSKCGLLLNFHILASLSDQNLPRPSPPLTESPPSNISSYKIIEEKVSIQAPDFRDNCFAAF